MCENRTKGTSAAKAARIDEFYVVAKATTHNIIEFSLRVLPQAG
jgi:hypothetical protein